MGESGQLGFVVAITDRGGFAESLERAFGIPGEHAPESRGVPQVTLLDTVQFAAIE